MGLREECEIKKASIHAGLRAKTLYESQMLSSQGRYNHFDTLPCINIRFWGLIT